jgi:drug/metabolite transporter (DMT)-like permease
MTTTEAPWRALPAWLRSALHSPAVLVFTCCLLWSSVEIVGGTIPREYSAVQTVWMRYAMHLLFVLAYVAMRGKWRELRTRRPFMQFARGSMMLGMPLAYLAGVMQSDPRTVLGIFWAAPLATLAFAALWLKERVTRRHWALAGAAYAAAVLLFRPSIPSAGVLLAGAGMAAAITIYMLLTKRLADEGLLVALLSTSMSVFVCLTLPVMKVWVLPDPLTAVKMLAVGVLGFLFLWVFDLALHTAPASVVAPLLGAQPVVAVLERSLLAGHSPGRSALLGAVLISLAAFLLVRRDAGAVLRPEPS